MRLEFSAVPAACLDEELLQEIPWEPSAVVSSPDHLELGAVWPFPDPTACGSCLYDFTFEAEVPEWHDTLAVELETQSCLSCTADTRSFRLPPPTATPQETCEAD